MAAPLRILDPREPDYLPTYLCRGGGVEEPAWAHVFVGPVPARVPAPSTVVCGPHRRESEVAPAVAGPVRMRVVGPLEAGAEEEVAFGAPRGGPVRPLPYGRFGLNNVPFFEVETDPAQTKYGRFPALLRDMRELGVGVVRHPTQVQLLPDKLIPSATSPWSWPLPVPPASRVAILVRHSQPILDLEEAIRSCAAQKIECRFFLTFLTTGGGFAASSARYNASGVQDYQLGVATEWSTDHEGKLVVDDYGNVGGFETSTERDWNLGTLHPNNTYKRYFCRELAKAVGQALEDLRADLATSGIRLEDYIEAIEIGNEVDVRNVKWDPHRADYYPDSEAWGLVYYDCATALFDATARAGASWLKLRLPGLASNADGTALGGAYMEWESKRVWVEEVLARVDRSCSDHGAVYSLQQLVTGMDLHYYHRFADTSRSDIQRLAFIATDVGDVARAFTAAGLTDPTLSIFESMVNAACVAGAGFTPNGPDYDNGCVAELDGTSGWIPYPAFSVPFPPDPVADWRPIDTSADCPPKVDTAADPFPESDLALGYSILGPNDYQAIAVWHRLAVGLAAASLAGLGAGRFIAGWHGLVLANSGSFGVGGLRRDAHRSTGSPFDPAKALPRPGWFAMQRFIDVLGRATGVGVLSPRGLAGITHQLLQKALDGGIWPAEDDVWVVEFENPGGWSPVELMSGAPDVFPWAYLAFVDPNSSVVRCAEVTLSSGGTPFDYLRVGTAPAWASTIPHFLARPDGTPDNRGFSYVDWEPEPGVNGRSTNLGYLTISVSDHEYPTLVYARRRMVSASVVVR